MARSKEQPTTAIVTEKRNKNVKSKFNSTNKENNIYYKAGKIKTTAEVKATTVTVMSKETKKSNPASTP